MNPWMRWLVTFAWTPFLCCGESPAERFHRESIAQLPGTPHALFVDGCATNLLHHGSAADATFSVVEVPDQPFGHAVRVAVKQRTSPAWKVQLISHPNAAAIKKGDVLYIGLSLRCLASKAETGGGSLFATLQQVKTYDSLGNLHASPGTNWTRVHLRTVAQQDYPAQNIELVFHLGSAEQILEFGGLVAVNLGPGVDLRQLPLTRIHYSGQGDNQPWRQEALARIEAIRKGDLTIHLQRTNNTPITHATVRIRMTRHAYQFGTFIEHLVLEDNPEAKRYRETVHQLFNRVTCPIYWSDWGWEDPAARQRYLAIAQWAKQQGFYTRGHCLVWPGWRWLPKRIAALKENPVALRRAIDDHFSETVTALKGIGFDTYDVMNEPRDNHALMDILGADEPVRWLKMTHALDPHPVLGINEYSILSGGGDKKEELALYIRQLRALQAAGAPLGVIGVQCHMGENLTPPQKIIEILDQLATLKLPIHATEFDIATDDEATQGDYMRDFLIAFFSHPATESLTQWGFWETRHWIPRAALFAKDWRIKPNGQAYLDLVKGAWWTDATVTTDAHGTCTIRGFLGDYEIMVPQPDGSTQTYPARIVRTPTTVTFSPRVP